MVEVNYRMVRWGTALIFFLAISLTALAFLMQPPKVYEETVYTQGGGAEDGKLQQPKTFEQNIALLDKSWTEYPEYTRGLTIVMVIGGIGSVFSVYSFYKEKEPEEELIVEEEPA